jgi:glucose/arabinose dehydrogenase
MRNLRSTPLSAAILLLSITIAFQSLQSQPVLGFTSVVSGFSSPVDVVAEPGSSRLFVVEQGGTIRIVNGTTVLPTPFLNVSSLVTTGGERGLLSLAFHPGYLTNRCFFIYYTGTGGTITLARYRRHETNPDIADPSTDTIVLTIPHPVVNHNGGKLNFGTDGNLYFATGDGGDANDPPNNAQNGNSLLGKMIRLNVDNFTTPPFYTIPADNPFVLDPAIRDEVWALGLRNPWRWSFDRLTGDMWIADVGQNGWEEVNYRTPANSAGVNYGWRCREALHPNPSLTCTPTLGTAIVDPIFEYDHIFATGGFSITGGYVYRGSTYPALNNYYVTADYVSGNTWIVRSDGFSRRQGGLASNISGFGEDNNGEMYALSRSAGTLLQVVVTAVLPVTLVNFTGKDLSGYNQLKWTTASEENTQKFIIEYSLPGGNYQVAGEVPATGNSNGSTYTFNHQISNDRVIKYRLHIVDIDASGKYSPVISLGGGNNTGIKLYPTVITSNSLQVISGPVIESIDIFTIDGKRVYSKTMNGASGYFTVPLPSLQKGMYLVKLRSEEFEKTERIVVQ